MTSRSRSRPLLCLVALLAWHGHATAQTSTSTDDVRSAGDIIQIALPLGALATTYFKDDNEGMKQLVKSFALSWVTVQGIKYTAERVRPDETSANSYPSGHTQAAFSGAAFFQTRYGAKWGAPAYLLATTTAISRVAADRHFSDDVVAAAGISMLSNWLFVTPMAKGMEISPMILSGGAGVSLNFTGVPEVAGEITDDFKHFRFELELGPTDRLQNLVASPNTGDAATDGTLWDLATFDEQANPTFTSKISFQWFIDEDAELMFSWDPWEVRDNGTLPTTTSFAGQSFAANTPSRAGYAINDIRARYRWDFFPQKPFDLRAGIGGTLTSTQVTLTQGAIEAEVTDETFLPFLHLQLGYEFSKRFTAFVSFDGMELTDDYLADGAAVLQYRFNDAWDMHLAYHRVERSIGTNALFNHMQQNRYMVGFGHSW
jgi:membrane-associated phospholipid phosphatase